MLESFLATQGVFAFQNTPGLGCVQSKSRWLLGGLFVFKYCSMVFLALHGPTPNGSIPDGQTGGCAREN